MPPKVKFTKEQIVRAALEIVRENGIDALSARTLGRKLGTSSCPIFTAFDNMEALLAAVKQEAMSVYSAYIQVGLQETPAFKGVGRQYISFAVHEPKLFQFLFMSEQPSKPSLEHILPIIDDNYPLILSSVETSYRVKRTDAEKIYRHLWIYSHGIAVLIATNTCAFTADEIRTMSAEVVRALMLKIQSEGETGHDSSQSSFEILRGT